MMSCNKSPFYGVIPALLIALTVGLNARAAEPTNILFICIDDLRPELNCYGAGHMLTPNIDRLAAQGIRFDRAYCQQAVCLPSRVSLFTGMRPDSTGVHDLQTHFRDTIPDVVTLPQHLRKTGYHTIAMGKVYHDEQPAEWDDWTDTKHASKVPEYHLDEIVSDIQKREADAKSQGLRGKRARQFVKGPSVEAADRPDHEYHDAAMTDIAIAKLQATGDKPFFMTVGYHKPHLPLVAPKKYWNLYDREKITLPDNYFRPKDAPQLAMSTWGELRAYSDIPAEGPVTHDKAIELIHGYYACVSFVDVQVGRLLDALKKNDLDRDTLVILSSDHGWKLGEHFMWCKHTNFEIDARVPLIVRLPGQSPAGRTASEMVELVDLYPTICEFAGVGVPEHCEGVSLKPLLREEPPTEWRTQAMSQFKRSRKTGGDIIGYSLKLNSGRYTEWINQKTNQSKAFEFYDHQKDPDENQNVYSQLTDEQTQSFSERLRAHAHQ